MASLSIGVIVRLTDRPEGEIRKVADLGLKSCQICSWDPAVWTDRTAERQVEACGQFGVGISSFWSGYPGPKVWNFIDGPATIGLVPPQYRTERVETLKRAANFAASLHLPAIATHVGFLPEDPRDPRYDGAVEAIKEVAEYCGEMEIGLWFETGQETPVTLLRTIQRVGTENLGVNLDPANLIMYGKGNPIDSLEVLGRYVREVHAKDGLYPTDGTRLGREVPLGRGKVDFPALVGRLKELGFAGVLTIEREIKESDQQIRDIRKAIELLAPLC